MKSGIISFLFSAWRLVITTNLSRLFLKLRETVTSFAQDQRALQHGKSYKVVEPVYINTSLSQPSEAMALLAVKALERTCRVIDVSLD
jgi:hypothetical protein